MSSGPYAPPPPRPGPGDYVAPGTYEMDEETRRQLREAAAGARGSVPPGEYFKLSSDQQRELAARRRLAPVDGGRADDGGEELGYDQVKRARRIMRANAGLMITMPRQNGTGHYVADWTTENETSGRAHHWDLRRLLDDLTTKHGFEDA